MCVCVCLCACLTFVSPQDRGDNTSDRILCDIILALTDSCVVWWISFYARTQIDISVSSATLKNIKQPDNIFNEFLRKGDGIVACCWCIDQVAQFFLTDGICVIIKIENGHIATLWVQVAIKTWWKIGLHKITKLVMDTKLFHKILPMSFCFGFAV